MWNWQRRGAEGERERYGSLDSAVTLKRYNNLGFVIFTRPCVIGIGVAGISAIHSVS
jgi:hypothetical protein